LGTAMPSLAGNYSVLLTNVAGSLASSNALLSVYGSTAPTLSAAGFSSGQFQLALAGVPGYSYMILVSTNLETWSALQTNRSPFTFTDTTGNGSPYRFYRALYSP
jgi:hypothetical protein